MALTQTEACAHQVLERTGRELVLSCSDVVEKLMGLVWSKDLKTLRYTTGNSPAGYLDTPAYYLYDAYSSSKTPVVA